jgi:predicted metal-dependent phosphoesterase TrpH
VAVDLHIHTNVSDGIYTPEEVVQQALQASLEAIAITDHDIMDGVARAQKAAEGKKIEIVPGIELSAEYKHGDIHILGYYVDPMNSEFLNHLSIIRNARKERVTKIVEKLFKLGVDIDISEITRDADNISVCRSHVAQAMIMSGIVKNKKEAFKRYIGIGKPAYVPRVTINPLQAIKLILLAKGVPVLAHPGSGKNSVTFINALIDAGIKGIEVYHRDHNLKQIKLYTKIAKKNNLIITGGSDFHGFNNEYSHPIGSCSVSYTVVEDLKKFSSTVSII